MDFPSGYSSNDRQKVLDILEDGAFLARDDILNIRDLGEKTDSDTGKLGGGTVMSQVPGIMLSAIRRSCSEKNYNLEKLVHVEFERDELSYNFNSADKPLLLMTIDGRKQLRNYSAYMRDFRNSRPFNIQVMRKPESVIGMSLFEGPQMKDITVGVAMNMDGDMLSAKRIDKSNLDAFYNQMRLPVERISKQAKDITDSDVWFMAHTNYNIKGMAELASRLLSINAKEFGEITMHSSGSTLFDIMEIWYDNVQAYVDARALYHNSLASLKISKIAPLIPFVFARGYEIRDLNNMLHDESVNCQGVFHNRNITLLLATNRNLADKIYNKIENQIKPSIRDWKSRLDQMQIVVHPDWQYVDSFGESPYKVGYVGSNDTSKQKRYVQKFTPDERGLKYLKNSGKTLQQMLKSEGRLSLMSDSHHPNIVEALPPQTGSDGSVWIISEVCDGRISELYKPGIATNNVELFYGHALQLVSAIACGHNHPGGAIVHGDLKLANILLKEGVLKLGDYGISRRLNEINLSEVPAKHVGSINTRAPELFFRGQEPTVNSDLYALGAVLMRLKTGYYPLHDPNEAKPEINSSAREGYESRVFDFRANSGYYEPQLRKMLSCEREELRDLVMMLLHRKPDKRGQSADKINATLEMIANRHRIYKELKSRIKEEVARARPESYLNPHLMDTLRQLKKLDPGSSYAQLCAAMLHDYERLRANRSKLRKNENYSSYKRRHAKAGADISENVIREMKGDDSFTNEIKLIIQFHEHQNLPRYHTDLHRKFINMRNADSLSYFHCNLEPYMHQHDDDRIRTKVNFMWNKMSPTGHSVAESEAYWSIIRPYIKDSS